MYPKWIEWNEQDQIYIGKCPDLISGIHGENPVQLIANYAKLLKKLYNILKRKGAHALILAFVRCRM
jgi:hypothetical protein